MAYIKTVKNTANQSYNLHDSRLGDGEEFNIVKDWAVNNTKSTKYIANRTHYTDNDFELIYPDWNGYFSDEFAPEVIELNNGMVLYKLTNTPITTTIVNSDLEDIIVFYKVSGSAPKNTKNMAQIFEGQTVQIQLPAEPEPPIGNYVEKVRYGTTTDTFTIYNVTAKETVEIGNKTLELNPGIYTIGNPDGAAADIHPIKKPDHVVQLEDKYISDTIARILALENKTNFSSLTVNYNAVATEQYVNSAITSAISGDISNLLSGKMDKNNPVGTGDFILTKGTNASANIITEGTVYVNNVSGYAHEVATKDWAMPATQTDFTTLTINQVPVLTTNDLPQIPDFKGYFGDSNFLNSVSAQNGDYAYVWDTYTVSQSPATARKYVYSNLSGWALANPAVIITNTFTTDQWENINTNINSVLQPYITRINSLENRVAELEDIIETMFEFAESQEF